MFNQHESPSFIVIIAGSSIEETALPMVEATMDNGSGELLTCCG
jgi:hypothetical protein